MVPLLCFNLYFRFGRPIYGSTAGRENKGLVLREYFHPTPGPIPLAQKRATAAHDPLHRVSEPGSAVEPGESAKFKYGITFNGRPISVISLLCSPHLNQNAFLGHIRFAN